MEMGLPYILLATFLALCFTSVSGLECYACGNQPDNRGKCIKTVIQCEQHEDMCLTQVKWGIPPYWTPRGDRIHYISKDCSNRGECAAEKSRMMTFCKRDWYNDWACVECCAGDLCNYYVTMGVSAPKASVLTVLLSGLLLLWYHTS